MEAVAKLTEISESRLQLDESRDTGIVTMPTTSSPPNLSASIADVVRRFWGFDALRPLQGEAIEAALTGRDSLVVLPTGGGKSLCYQVPPAVDGATDVVVSPLISLMKDQVDGLRESGYPAAALHSGMTGDERRDVERRAAAGEYRLLFVAPERVLSPWCRQLCGRLNVRRFAIDEAHCISHWGHDFRPEYRQLAALREHFPDAVLNAFTATATPRVREDIARQLELRDPALLVGRFDRPNLVYRVVPVEDRNQQIIDVLRRHVGEAVIVYCISRRDSEGIAAMLVANGVRAAHYHAGLTPEERHRTQEAFADERLDVVVATVAFGMGIDRSNVRCVLHTALPKSVEHYQQETGRAGRDGLEAECVLLYSFADVMKWESLFAKSLEELRQRIALSETIDEEGERALDEILEAQRSLLQQLQRYCTAAQCRHKALSEYFGQRYEPADCGACDLCLGELEGVEDGTVAAQKILSCVARTEQRFGVGHVVDVLVGADSDMVRRCRHNELSTYGLLKEMPKKHLQALVYQLVDQGLLARTEGDRPVLQLNDASWEVMRGKRSVNFLRSKKEGPKKTQFQQQSWEGADRGLFDHLRGWRREVAEAHQVPPFVIMSDSVLVELARVRPTSLDLLRQVRGIGEKRLADLGTQLVNTIRGYCREQQLATDIPPATLPSIGVRDAPVVGSSKKPNEARLLAFKLFSEGWNIDDVKHKIERAHSTTVQYLVEYIASEQPASIEPWVAAPLYQRISAAIIGVQKHSPPEESWRLSPIFAALDGAVAYDDIRLVVAHLRANPSAVSPRA
jgi:ATP-dependent DNA helicase RecQ